MIDHDKFFKIFLNKLYTISSLNEMIKELNMKKLIRIFKVLSDRNRLRILLMLERKPLCVCELQFVLKITISTVSKHLSILREAGFISDEKAGKWVNYKINRETEDILIQQFIMFLQIWLNDDEQMKSDYEKIKEIDRNVICNT